MGDNRNVKEYQRNFFDGIHIKIKSGALKRKHEVYFQTLDFTIHVILMLSFYYLQTKCLTKVERKNENSTVWAPAIKKDRAPSGLCTTGIRQNPWYY